jgi:hypothetical protein
MTSSHCRTSDDSKSYRISHTLRQNYASIDRNLSSTAVDMPHRLSMTTSSVIAHVIAHGPPVAFYGSCVIGNTFYIHGGVRTRADRAPSNRMFKFQGRTWTDITTSDSPTLSYHRCVAMNNGQFLVTIGGWNGSKRKADIHVYDVREEKWYSTDVSGFPSDGGLNNHAVIPMKNSPANILVIGRDGSLRIQRKHGDAYCLHADVLKRRFR